MILEEGEDFKAGLNGCKHRNPDVCVCLVVVLDVDLYSQITSYMRDELNTPVPFLGERCPRPCFHAHPSLPHTPPPPPPPHFGPSWNPPLSNSSACLLQPVTPFGKQIGGNHRS
ncbi:unnamed protein product [Litomosoides sigmodontis]|uniref:Uncharacterized protein n=1 Tax=Litomosoides sigmodontis TaxID=42156 RepID=A0A3P6SW08_LITSI|nr:unnamed protein product [Litomosoides sigmodontis]